MKKQILTATLGVAALAGVANAQAVPFTGGTYSQNFDSLPSTGTGITGSWVNDSTLDGWNLFRSAAPNNRIDAGTGSSNSGQFYSFGAASDGERALGSIASGSSGIQTYTLVLQNNTGAALTQWSLSYDGEQWRDGGQGSFAPTFHTLVFDYLVSNDASDGTLLGGGFSALPALNFTGPVSANATTTGNALDGNLGANRVAGINGGASVVWNPGEFLILRWSDANDAGNDHGLGIDNLTFEAVPSPGALALLGLGGLVAARRRRA